MKPIVAIGTCVRLPEPDRDAHRLREALERARLTPRWLAWDDPGASTKGAALCVLRSTWNYYRRPDDFVAWLRRTAGEVPLYNPLETVLWNMHKGYLLELAKAGVPVVPTMLFRRGETAALDDALARWGRIVVKPAVSAASFATMRVDTSSRVRGTAHLAALAAERDVLVQPYLASVEGHGERSLVWIDGALTHAVRKAPRFADGVERVSDPRPIADDERALAERTLAAVGEPLLYARIDVARDARGRPLVMELELIEPSLFFANAPLALARFAEAIRARAT